MLFSSIVMGTHPLSSIFCVASALFPASTSPEVFSPVFFRAVYTNVVIILPVEQFIHRTKCGLFQVSGGSPYWPNPMKSAGVGQRDNPLGAGGKDSGDRGSQATGDRRQATGGRGQESGDRRQGTGGRGRGAGFRMGRSEPKNSSRQERQDREEISDISGASWRTLRPWREKWAGLRLEGDQNG